MVVAPICTPWVKRLTVTPSRPGSPPCRTPSPFRSDQTVPRIAPNASVAVGVGVCVGVCVGVSVAVPVGVAKGVGVHVAVAVGVRRILWVSLSAWGYASRGRRLVGA